MVKFTDIINREYYQKYKLFILLLFLAILFFGFAIYKYNNYMKPMNKDNDISNANRRVNITEIYFFNATWCPHCVQAKPAWLDFVSSYDKSIVNGYTIKCIDIDCSTTDDPQTMEVIQKYNVEHYPTIKLVKDKVVIDFDAKVTKENLTQFVNTVL